MLQEQRVLWENGTLIGEGSWISAGGESAVVICHPHPQMGGSMHNNVVETIRDVFAAQRYSTLRFNFRGVGGSTGQYDEGRGEIQDICSACDYARMQGVRKIILAGYSFGAWVICRLLKNRPSDFQATILVSPPDKFSPFEWNGLEGKISFIVNGKLDPFCDNERIDKISARIGAIHLALDDVDHFYAGDESRLAAGLSHYLKEKQT